MRFGLILLLFIAFFAIAVPILSPYNSVETHLSIKNQPPTLAHWFGTDDLGRDLFTRVWYGTQISLTIGFLAAFIDLGIGMIWGASAGFAGGKTDQAMMRIADILYALPYLLIVTILMVSMGSGLYTIVVAMSIIGWITMARVVRGQVLHIKEQPYVLAAKSLGAGFWRIVFTHLLPNAKGPILVTLLYTIRSAIFVEAFLSFLGLGVPAPLASLGTMTSDALPAMTFYPWRLFFPAATISLTLLSINLVAEEAM